MPDKKPPVFNGGNHEIYALDRSPELQHTITGMPKWLLRFGLVATLVLIVALVAGASLITFPETINVPIVIQTVWDTGGNNAEEDFRIDALLTGATREVQRGQAVTIFLPGTKDCIRGTIIEANRCFDEERMSVVINAVKPTQEMPPLKTASSCNIQIADISIMRKMFQQITQL